MATKKYGDITEGLIKVPPRAEGLPLTSYPVVPSANTTSSPPATKWRGKDRHAEENQDHNDPGNDTANAAAAGNAAAAEPEQVAWLNRPYASLPGYVAPEGLVAPSNSVVWWGAGIAAVGIGIGVGVGFDSPNSSAGEASTAPTITSNGGGDATALSISENLTYVTTVTATDRDARETLHYSISGGADAAFFTIDSNSGTLAFTSAPNFEMPTDAGGNNVYDVRVTVTDHNGLTDSQDLAVTVVNGSEAPVITSNGAGATATLSVSEGQTSVTTVTATDPDTGNPIVYTISGGADAALFAIDPDTGVLTFLTAPNFETPTDAGSDNVYDVQVTVTDHDGLTAVQNLAVTVTNGNEAPIITSGATGTVAENIAPAIVYTAVATDNDAGATLTFSLGGADAAAFTIDPATGAVTLNAAADFESKPSYSIDVIATDNHGLTATEAVTIAVTNVNEAPVITSGTSGTVAENAPLSTVLYTAAATDVDAGDTLTFRLAGADAAAFTIDAATGAVTLNAPADFETQATYHFDVLATDSQGLTATEAVTISVTNANEAPVITSGASGTVAENAPLATVVYTAAATDVDAGDTLTFSLAGTDAAAFTIDPATGAVTLNAPADFETQATYHFDVLATDSLGLTATEAVTISVTNVNEAPVITSGASGTVVENAPLATVVYTAAATDVDAGDPITFSLGGADAAAFTIDAATGAVTLNAAADFESKPSYSLDVIATDSHGLTATEAVTISVSDVNEPPTITSGASGTVAENAPLSTVVYAATASDVDAGDPLAFSLGGADAAAFTIDAATGEVRLKSPADFETRATYNIDVIATDSHGLADSKAVTISVANINEAPVITSNGGNDFANISVSENQTAVTTVTSHDPDGAPVTYSISGGVDQALFHIDPNTGVLAFNAAPDFETPVDAGGYNIYDVQVTATDAGGLTAAQDLLVSVSNVNEAPVITSGTTGAVTENAPLSTVVYAADASDIDAGDTLTFSLGGTDATAFSINAATGEVRLTAPADFETRATYNIDVIATDSHGLADTKAVTITVANINEAPVITSNGGGATAAVSVSENQSAVTSITSSDSDVGATVVYILSGADAGLFTLNSITGVLTFAAPPNFEAPADAGANNIYDVQVIAIDNNGLTDLQSLAVTVTNVNEPPTITSGTTGSVAENAALATVIYDAAATDVDGGDTITYSLSGTDAAALTIDTATGAVTLKTPADFESQGLYHFNVIATDNQGLTDTEAVTIAVTNINEAALITSGATGVVDENAPPDTVVYTAAASDPDAGDSVTYSLGGADAAAFTIDTVTGEITLNTSADFESQALYHLNVIATDNHGLPATTAVTISVTDINEAPTITSNDGGDSKAFSINENQTDVTTVTAADPDSGDSAVYAISGGADAGLFAIDASTGILTFLAPQDFETPTDAGNDHVYDVQVTVTDHGGLTDIQDLAISVDNLNEAPTITSDGGGATAAISVSENQTSVTTVTAADPDRFSTATYSISGGADAGRFAIDANSGILTFLAAPDFENPLDAGNDHVYDVQVTVTDADGLTDVQDLAVSVADRNEAPIITSDGGGATATLSVNENQTSVTTVTASDPDSGDSAVYAISGGADAGRFAIDATTGVLTFLAAPDFEAPDDAGNDHVYDLQVTVTDNGGLTAVQDLSITVDNANDAPVIDGGATVALSVNENQTSVTTITASDPDSGATAVYAISGGADAGRFVIDADTGVLTFLAAPDFEAPNDTGNDHVYDVQVTVTDNGGLTDIQDLSITVDNANDAPVIGGGATAALNVNENQTSVTTITAADPDSGATAVYAISGGADAGRFAIDADTGVLTFLAPPDFETPNDAGNDHVYDVQVTVTDNGGLTDIQDLSITVDNANDAPVIDGGATATLSVSENQTSVTTITATDQDLFSTTVYAISGGADAGRFAIDADTGVLTFVAAPDFEAPNDTGNDHVYDVQVTVTDNGGLTDIQDLSITVGNGNDAPVIGGGATAALSVNENQTSVTTITASDPDSGDSAVYAISGGADAGHFAIDADTGVLTFVAAPDFETPLDAGNDHIYDVQVTVTDNGGLTDVQDLSITVADQNEAPTITSDGGGATAALSVSENQTSVTTVTATDPDSGATAVYAISGGADAGRFALDADTGVLTFLAAPDFEAPNDTGNDHVYDVQVTVTDNGGMTGVQDLSITVGNVNETPPAITSDGGAATAALSVNENQISVTTITATDLDSGDTAVYTISGGVDAGRFAIDANSGVLTFVAPPDFEAPTDSGSDHVYDVQVTATDSGGLTDTQDLSVTITDVKEDPTITSNGGAAVAALSVDENQTAVTTVTSTDPDSGATAVYTISGGADAGRFALDANTGVLTFLTAPDFETPDDADNDHIYNVQVSVTDNDGLTDVQDLSITVDNVNETPPVIISNGGDATAGASVNENETTVTTIIATDQDTNDTAIYTISGGADAGRFTIDAVTGVLTFVTAPDFETPLDAGNDNVYDVQVTATDSGGLTDVQDLSVTVFNLNETAPTITSDGGGMTAALSVNENQTAVTTITSADPDTGATATYTISGGADAGHFALDANSGVLTFLAPPDFEAPNDAGSDRIYDVQVTVSDGGLTDVQDLSITVTDLNEAPTITSATTGTVEENADISTIVYTAAATEVDAGDNVTFSLGGADATAFTIDSVTGEVTLTAPADFETRDIYNINVIATDSHGLSDSEAVTISVIDRNETPVITSGATGTVTENADVSTIVYVAAATDPDGGDSVTYSLGGTDAGAFDINNTTGEVTLKVAADYETQSSYTIDVIAADSHGLSSSETVTIAVTPINDNSPQITSVNTLDLAENTTEILTITATDADRPAQTLSYSITGGVDQALFAVDSGTGVLSFVTPPNFEIPSDSGADNIYDVQVTVSDDGGLTDVQNLVITVTDLNEAPVITSNGSGASAAFSVSENQTSVTTVTSSDADAGAAVTYSLSGGVDQALFHIDAGTGVLTFVAAPDAEAPADADHNNIYDVQVTVTDNGSLSDSQDLAVTVTHDFTPPATPGTPTATDDVPSSTGTIHPLDVTNDATPLFSGDTEAGATIHLYDNGSGTSFGTTTADSAGHWSYTPTTPLAAGDHAVTVTATDLAGNSSDPSAALNFTVTLGVVVERDGAWLDTNGNGIHDVSETTVAHFGSSENADLTAHAVNIHFNDVPLDALNLTGFGIDDKIEFDVTALQDNNILGPAATNHLSGLNVLASTLRYHVHNATLSLLQNQGPVIDFNSHIHSSVYGLSIYNIKSPISNATGSLVSFGAIAYWSDSANKLNSQSLVLPDHANTAVALTHLNAGTEHGLIDFVLPVI